MLRSEYPTGKSHSGRIDTLGIDENGCPVIIEYKRLINENVINQGLFYLDWLLDHQADFKLLVLESFKEEIDWSSPRLICIASDFTKYDEHAVKQINRNIDLVRYKRFGSDLLLLELVHSTTATETEIIRVKKKTKSKIKVVDSRLKKFIEDLDLPISDLFETLRSYLFALGDDVQEKTLKYYIACRKFKNFLEVVPQKKSIVIFSRIDPKTVKLEEGFTRDVRNIGHWGTGKLEITIKNTNDFEKAKKYIGQSYDQS